MVAVLAGEGSSAKVSASEKFIVVNPAAMRSSTTDGVGEELKIEESALLA